MLDFSSILATVFGFVRVKLVAVGCLPLYSNKATLARDES